MTTHHELNEIFAECTDFELCSTLHSVIEDVYGFEALLQRKEHIPRERWVIHCVIANTGFFDCEGYSYFWGTNLDHRGFAEALDEIGFDILARIIRDYAELVPPEVLGKWDAVESHTDSEEAREAAEHMDDKFISEHPNFDEKTARYARARRHSFVDLLDKLVIGLRAHREMFREYQRESGA
jgi:hypothetical protein